MESSAKRWVDTEFSAVELGDFRLEQRFRSILTDLARHCGKTLASSFDSWAKIKASYRFFANPRVQMRAMLAPHIAHTVERIREYDTVLLAQDTTYLETASKRGLCCLYRYQFVGGL